MNLIIGGFLILMGFLVKKFPDMIAGYNTMPEEQKKNVDVEGLSSMMRNAMVLMGLLIAVGKPFLGLIGWEINPALFIISVILSITAVMLVLAPTYDGNKHPWYKKAFPFVVIIGISLFVGFKIFKTHEPLEAFISEDRITVTGEYGLTQKVTNIQLLENIPNIKTRSGGYSDGMVRKGNFILEDWGACTLFLLSDKKPYIKVTTAVKPIIINFDNPENTKKQFDRLQEEFNQ
ncbi:DUF3784 domain-containing protein [Reichenbachiella sp. MALMAid0571]|uniref:DUF3784 domain-containing protein n=1 Tax=Reichenbachiella sp. MALMAid0571 TaxID=3143939 RepID=UPI0032E022C7